MNPSYKLITSNSMLESMGTIDVLKEDLRTLLHNWKMDDLTEFFMGKIKNVKNI